MGFLFSLYCYGEGSMDGRLSVPSSHPKYCNAKEMVEEIGQIEAGE